jgi:GNAT superfamily N-acetyltransferase
MYVRSEYRQRTIGACLVQALLDHCRENKVKAVELWTGGEGAGRKLYEKMGFQVTAGPGKEFPDLFYRTNYLPGEDEIRMRIDLG